MELVENTISYSRVRAAQCNKKEKIFWFESVENGDETIVFVKPCWFNG